jgi:hypothetical protein
MKRGPVETYRASPTVDRVVAVIAAAAGVALLGWADGWGPRTLGAGIIFLAVARWSGVNKRAVFQTDEFLVLRGSLFSRRLAWEQVSSAAVGRRGPLYFGLVVRAAGGRKYRPGGVGYFGVRRRSGQPVDGLAAAINDRARAGVSQSATG